MLKTITCKSCNSKVESNPRIKVGQKYCGKPECQRARKRKWQREKMKSDEEYKKKQTEQIKCWREKHLWHNYMSQYRETHPDYVEINRKKQKGRNEKRKEREKSFENENIVKMDALSASSIKTRHYRMRSMKRDSQGNIVKMDTLYVELKQIKGLSAIERLIGK